MWQIDLPIWRSGRCSEVESKRGKRPSAELMQLAKVLDFPAPDRREKYNILQRYQHTTMKRKLNSEDVPEAVASEGGDEQAAPASQATFASLNLDARILQAITKEKFTEPTPVQAATLPLALNGKDILGM